MSEKAAEAKSEKVLLETDPKGLTIRFGGLTAVKDFRLKLCEGELVGLIGPNGAGKTTAFNLLTGVYQPTEGWIRLGEKIISADPKTMQSSRSPQGFVPRGVVGLLVRAYRKLENQKQFPPHQITKLGLTRTFQNIRLFKDLTVLDNVMTAMHQGHRAGLVSSVLRLGSFFREEDGMKKEAQRLLELMGLAEHEEREAKNLPYGAQRRLEIARALATKPKLILLDEPAAGMNDTETDDLMHMIRRLRQEFGVTILLIEHDMGLVMGICERLIVLNQGQIISEGTPEQVRKDPEVIKAYLGEEE